MVTKGILLRYIVALGALASFASLAGVFHDGV